MPACQRNATRLRPNSIALNRLHRVFRLPNRCQNGDKLLSFPQKNRRIQCGVFTDALQAIRRSGDAVRSAKNFEGRNRPRHVVSGDVWRKRFCARAKRRSHATRGGGGREIIPRNYIVAMIQVSINELTCDGRSAGPSYQRSKRICSITDDIQTVSIPPNKSEKLGGL